MKIEQSNGILTLNGKQYKIPTSLPNQNSLIQRKDYLIVNGCKFCLKKMRFLNDADRQTIKPKKRFRFF